MGCISDLGIPDSTSRSWNRTMTSAAQKVCNEIVKELRKKPTGDDCTMIVVQFIIA